MWNLNCLTSYNTNIFKISQGFASTLKAYDSLNLARGRACFYVNFTAFQLYYKSQAGINICTFWTTFEEWFCVIRIMFSLVWRAAFRCSIFSFLEALCLAHWLLLKNQSGDAQSLSWRHFTRSSPCGERALVSASMRLPSRSDWLFSEMRKRHKHKLKSIEMIAFGPLITSTYVKAALVSYPNWNLTIRSIWFMAGCALWAILALFKFT